MDLERLLDFVRTRRYPLLAVGLLVVLGLVMTQLLTVVSPFLIALVLAYVLEPVLKKVQGIGVGKAKPSRMSCVLVIYTLFGVLLVTVGLPILVNIASGLFHIAHGLEGADMQAKAAQVVARGQELAKDLPLPEDVRQQIESFISDPKEVSKLLLTVLEKVRSLLASILRGGAGILTNALAAGVQLALVPILLFYFMLEFPDLRPRVLQVVPPPYREWTDGFMGRVDTTLGGFLRGQLLIAFLFGLIMTVGLWLIGIRYAIVLGPLSGVANLVPYLGVIVGLVPAFFLALLQGGLTLHAVYLCGCVLVLFVVLQMLDGYVFQPKILGPSVELHPLWIMLALAVGEHWMGLAGMMLAVPVAAVLRVILEDLYPLVYDEPTGPQEPAGSDESDEPDQPVASDEESE